MKIIYYKKKEMIPLTNEEKNKKFVIYAKKNFVLTKIIKNIYHSVKLEIIVIIQGNIEELLIVIVI